MKSMPFVETLMSLTNVGNERMKNRSLTDKYNLKTKNIGMLECVK